MSSTEPLAILPAPSPDQKYVTISALQAGHLTLPEYLFVTDTDPSKRATVPSLAFLIQHPSTTTPSKTDTLLFDLGLKRDFSGYREAQQHHIAQRQPTTVDPDAASSLRKGGVDPKAIDTVILSHVHWDHVGTPSDFPTSEFLVGSGTMHLLAHGAGPLYPSELFNPHELPHDRTREFPPTRAADAEKAFPHQTEHTWCPFSNIFPSALDFFADGSLYVIDAPGHLPGHVNLLARIACGKWVYLGGDCCHDPRILSGEKGIALYDDGKGGVRSVHADTDEAARTVERAARLLGKGRAMEEGGAAVSVEVVVAHDRGWAEANEGRFWPGCL
jgi:glyoxylase-like metal-dependent hydrolase (beta-lactamase superfamily II)